MIRVADYVIQRLVDVGIRHIFLVTGRGILYLTDAVAKNQDIQGISTYHEQGASYAAMAYASSADGMSACLVSTGCGATNAVTAALCAYQDNLPVIFISGQNILSETTRYSGVPIRTYGSQEADIIKIVNSVTKYSTMLTDASRVGYELDKLILMANEGRKGPVWIDIPLDIQNSRIDETNIEHFATIRTDRKYQNLSVVKTALEEADRPVLFVGGGLRSSGSIELLEQFVKINRIPVVFSTSAVDAYGSSNELSIGSVGSLGGTRAGNFTIQNADLVLALGTRLSSQSVGNFYQFAREARIIVVDIDEIEHTKKGVRINELINMDLKQFLKLMLGVRIEKRYEEWVNKCLHWKNTFTIGNEVFIKELINKNEIDIYHFAEVLSDCIENRATVITDAGLEELIIPSTIQYKKEQRCLFPKSQGAMGYAIPAIIGAHYANKQNIVCVVGDGSFMMNMQEIQLIGSLKIPAKIFVLNNNMYAIIRRRQQDLFRTRTIGNDPSDGLPSPDFEKIACSFGIKYRRINNERGLSSGIVDVLKMQGPVLCEVKCIEDQKYFHTSFAISANRHLVKRPLEDLSPFLDREIFNEEMVIKPIGE